MHSLIKEEDLSHLIAIGAVGSVAIISRTIFQWQWIGWIALPLTTFLIFLLALRLRSHSAGGKYPIFMLTGLFLSIWADGIFQFAPFNKNYFFIGLGLFALIQFLYAISFWSGKKFYKKDILPFFIFAIYATYIYLLLSKKITDEKYYLLLYIILISTMAWRAAATLYRRVFTSTQKLLIFIGSLLFLSSDTILAVHIFVRPLEYEALWILSTYFTAQTMFALSMRHILIKRY